MAVHSRPNHTTPGAAAAADTPGTAVKSQKQIKHQTVHVRVPCRFMAAHSRPNNTKPGSSIHTMHCCQ
jgi:hypothetical protein